MQWGLSLLVLGVNNSVTGMSQSRGLSRKSHLLPAVRFVLSQVIWQLIFDPEELHNCIFAYLAKAITTEFKAG